MKSLLSEEIMVYKSKLLDMYPLFLVKMLDEN